MTSQSTKLRKKSAESLQHQIDDLVSGRAEPGGRASFRDFVEHKMAEDQSKKSTAVASPEPKTGNSPEADPPNECLPGHE